MVTQTQPNITLPVLCVSCVYIHIPQTVVINLKQKSTLICNLVLDNRTLSSGQELKHAQNIKLSLGMLLTRYTVFIIQTVCMYIK